MGGYPVAIQLEPPGEITFWSCSPASFPSTFVRVWKNVFWHGRRCMHIWWMSARRSHEFWLRSQYDTPLEFGHSSSSLLNVFYRKMKEKVWPTIEKQMEFGHGSASLLTVFYTETKRKACLTIENKWNSGMAPLSFLKVFIQKKQVPLLEHGPCFPSVSNCFFDGGPCFPDWLTIKTLRNEAEPCPNSKGEAWFPREFECILNAFWLDFQRNLNGFQYIFNWFSSEF